MDELSRARKDEENESNLSLLAQTVYKWRSIEIIISNLEHNNFVTEKLYMKKLFLEFELSQAEKKKFQQLETT